MYWATNDLFYDFGRWLAENGPDIVEGAADPANLPLLVGAAALSVGGTAVGVKGASLGYQGAQRFLARPGDVSLGYRRRDRLDPFLDPLVLLGVADRSMGIQLVGPTGSGKTTFALPVIVQDLLRGHNAFIIEIFGDLGVSIVPYTNALGIPTFVLDPSDFASLRWNPLVGPNKEDVVERISAVMESLTDNPYYQESNYAITHHLVSLAWDFANSRAMDPDLELFDDLLNDRHFLVEVLKVTETDRRTRVFIEKTYLAWSDRDRDDKTSGLRNHLTKLLSNQKAKRSLCPTEGDRILDLREALSFPGACTVMRFPVTELHAAARTGAALAFRAMQDITYERAHQSQARQRPLSTVLDEMHTLVGYGTKAAVEYTRDWFTLVRKHGVMNLGAFQGYDVLPDALSGTVETNLRNLVVAGGLGPADLRKVREAFGTEETYIEDERRTYGPNGTTRSRGRRLGERYYFATHELKRLRRGYWAVSLLKNGNVRRPHIIKTPKAPSPQRIARSYGARRARARRKPA